MTPDDETQALRAATEWLFTQAEIATARRSRRAQRAARKTQLAHHARLLPTLEVVSLTNKERPHRTSARTQAYGYFVPRKTRRLTRRTAEACRRQGGSSPRC